MKFSSQLRAESGQTGGNSQPVTVQCFLETNILENTKEKTTLELK